MTTAIMFDPFESELGGLPFEAAATVSATLDATWGAWTGALTATVIPRIESVLAADWGAWTAASAATVHTPIEAVLSATWGAWNAQMSAVATSAPTINAVLAADWGAWTASLTATVIPRIESVLTADWGAWTASMVATVHTPIEAVLAATWGGWNGTLTATVIPRIEAVLVATWGGWTASMIANRHVVAVMAATWGVWDAESIAAVRPGNDPFTEAIVLVDGVPDTGTNVGASAEVGERGDGCPSVWYTYTAADDRLVTVTLTGTDFATLLEIFTGSLLALTLITSDPDTVTFYATGGTDYFIRVTGVGCAEGSFDIELETEPAPPVMAADWGGWYAHSFVRPHTPTRTSPLVPYTLGCGVYEAYIKTRGGYEFVGRVRNITGLKWSRVLNDVSEAEITFALNGSDGECCGLAATINPWEHELSIYRDGQEVWCGPITGGEIDLNELSATFQAKDLTAWFEHRWVEVADNDVDFDEVDITVLFGWLLSHGYWKDPFNLEWFVGDPLNIPITRTYTAYSPPERWGGVYPMIATELRDLTDSRIDFTTIRRVMVAGDLQTYTQAEPFILLDQDWIKLPKITIVGAGMATEQAVAGGNGGYDGYDDDQMYIEKPEDSYRTQFGLLQALDSAPEWDDVDTYDLPNPISQQAYELRELRKKPFVYLSGGTMSRHAPVTFDHLIPGRHFRVALNQSCRTVRSNYLLTRTDTTFDGESEEVSLELVPPGIDKVKGQ